MYLTIVGSKVWFTKCNDGKVSTLRWFRSVFLSKRPIFSHKNYRYSYIYDGKMHSVLRFSVKPPNIRENRDRMNIFVNFWIKVIKKCTHENA